MTFPSLFQARSDFFAINPIASKSFLAFTLILPGAHIQTGCIDVAATGAGQQAVVDLRAVSAVPGPSLLANACVGPRAGFDAFCIVAAAPLGESCARVRL